MDQRTKNLVLTRLSEIQKTKRKALSSRFPALRRPILSIRRTCRSLYNGLTIGPRLSGAAESLKYVLVRHRSPLVRKLGNTDVRLNLGKISNIKQAIKHVDGLVIPPGKIFSLWHQIGNPSQDRGYVNGMIISNGKVSEGIGGGLCQLSNFLFWMFLHCDVQILERRHHSLDIFPDSGRTLPFGSGASIFYNHIDLKVKNVSTNTLQLRIWLTDKYLCGQIRSDRLTQTKFKIREKNHYFIRKDGRFYRFNEIWREALNKGEKIREERMFVNFAPVLYQIGESDIKRNDYKLAEL